MPELPNHFVILDIGRAHTRAILGDLERRTEIEIREQENRYLPGPPFPHLDTARKVSFLLEALKDYGAAGQIQGVMVVGHGGTVAITDNDGLVLPVLDYEFPGPDELAEEYDRIRPPFAETGSPRMPGGLNAGAQLFWLRERFPDAFHKAPYLLLWPQLWTWWLCGRRVTEISSASSHTDLWHLQRSGPVHGEMGNLINGMMGAVGPAYGIAGRLRPVLVEASELPAPVPIHVGTTDSSLALVPHAGPGPRQPSVVLSTGEWLSASAIGVEIMPGDAAPGVMASLDIFGHLVPGYRLMAEKARADILATMDRNLPAPPIDRLRILRDPDTGIFGLIDRSNGRPARLAGNDSLESAARFDQLLAQEALAGMRRIGASGPIHLTGPMAGSDSFVTALESGWSFPVLARKEPESLVSQVATLFEQAASGRRNRG